MGEIWHPRSAADLSWDENCGDDGAKYASKHVDAADLPPPAHRKIRQDGTRNDVSGGGNRGDP